MENGLLMLRAMAMAAVNDSKTNANSPLPVLYVTTRCVYFRFYRSLILRINCVLKFAPNGV